MRTCAVAASSIPIFNCFPAFPLNEKMKNMGELVDSIPYVPDRAKYENGQSTTQNIAPEVSLPHGFPSEIFSDMVWDGDSISLDEHGFVNDGRYILKLEHEHLKEINNALKHFKTLEKPMSSLDSTIFPLPSLHLTLRAVSDNLHLGRGFSLIRGIPVDEYSREENMIIYVGLSSHIASIRGRQDHQYNGHPADVMVAHITDFSSTVEPGSATLPAYTDGEVIFHTDTGDIVSLFALEGPEEGGESLLASGWRVYNELAKVRPDLIEVLASDWPIPSTKKEGHIVRRPLLFHQASTNSTPERLLIHFSRRSFSGFGAWSHSNKLSAKQAEVLDMLHFLSERFHVAMPLMKGDMQFINNLSILHARNSYRDSPTKRRHLLRLWLRDPGNTWELPTELRSKWNKLYGDNFSNGEQVFPLEPAMRSAGKKSM